MYLTLTEHSIGTAGLVHNVQRFKLSFVHLLERVIVKPVAFLVKRYECYHLFDSLIHSGLHLAYNNSISARPNYDSSHVAIGWEYWTSSPPIL